MGKILAWFLAATKVFGEWQGMVVGLVVVGLACVVVMGVMGARAWVMSRRVITWEA